MVILFCERKSTAEKEIVEILREYGGIHIADNKVSGIGMGFNVISQYKKTDLNITKGIAVFCEPTTRFSNQRLPKSLIGICEDINQEALNLFKQNNISVISCGLNAKNTVTLSSISDNTYYVSLQRNISNLMGESIEPQELRITLSKSYNPFSVMAAAVILTIKGIAP